jgi:hypothetical protein
MSTPLEQFQSSLVILSKAGLGLWFPVWAWRRRGELDRPFTKPMIRCRALVVTVGLVLASLPIGLPSPVRAMCAVIAIAFWVWPNLGYHAIVLLRRGDLRHIVAELHRWDPLGFSGDPEGKESSVSVYDEYAPRVLAALDDPGSAEAVQAELTAIRAVWNVAPNPLLDRQVATDLVAWRKGGLHGAAA